MKTYYYVYKITNKVNGKLYIGVHKTDDLNDGYFGSGKYLKRAIKKHGIDNFDKEFVAIFNNPVDMFQMESELVNEEFVSRKDTYNMTVGGNGGFDYINSKKLSWFYSKENALTGRYLANISLKNKYGDNWNSVISTLGAKKTNELYKLLPEDEKLRRIAILHENAKSENSKKKRRQTFSVIGHQKGKNNSQYGTMWITNGVENRKIKKDQPIEDGWRKGRIILLL